MDDYLISGFLKVAGSEQQNPEENGINQAIRRWKGTQDASGQIVVAEMLLDNLIGNKTAQESMDEEACKILSMYVAFTRALGLLHQENHWLAQNYGDHLLFERLYDESQELLDDAAERAMGLCDKLMLEGAESVIAKRFACKEESLKGCLESSLSIEKAYQDLCKKTYDTLTEKKMMTLGLDDLIMAQASVGETHIYLLQQALKGV